MGSGGSTGGQGRVRVGIRLKNPVWNLLRLVCDDMEVGRGLYLITILRLGPPIDKPNAYALSFPPVWMEDNETPREKNDKQRKWMSVEMIGDMLYMIYMKRWMLPSGLM